MQNKSFLDFDISVSADKKDDLRKTLPKGVWSSVRTCQFDGCSEEAKYRALNPQKI